jgi:excisionase family DNA binding protein
MMNNILPVKVSSAKRNAALLAQHTAIRESKSALLVDPLMRLAEARDLLGYPSYSTIRSWIADGRLRVLRPGGVGPFKIRLSEIENFLRNSEVKADAS